MDAIKRYGTDFENAREDIVVGISEGLEEGIKEGIKDGFLDGIKDCLTIGFSNVSKTDFKSFKEILVDAFENASDKSIRSSIKKIVRHEYKSTLDPSFKKYMEKACSNMLDELRNSNLRLDSEGAGDMKDIIAFSIEKISEEFEKIHNKVRERLPTDMIFGSAVDGIQEGFQETFDENIKTCEERINREIDKKVTVVV